MPSAVSSFSAARCPWVCTRKTVARGVSAIRSGSVRPHWAQAWERMDVFAMGPKGEFWVVECKSSRADFTSDSKWQGYLEWGDRYFWAVDADFPTELLPPETGLIIADAYDAEIIRMGPEAKLAPARRKVMMQKFARHAARRLQDFRDPGVSAFSEPS
ncbi:MAG: MmcB family DNA repair protein [Maritimibacter sp.]